MDLPLKNLALFLGNVGPIVPGNISPVIADFTSSEFSPHTGQSVTLTVAASDADGDPLSYAYAFIAGSGTITGSGATVTATADNVGANTVRVTVSDGNGGTATRTLDLTGMNASPAISDFSATEGNPYLGQSVTLTVTASDADFDPLSYAYAFTAGSGTITGSGASVTVTVNDLGTNTIRVTVTDGHGGSASQTLNLTGTNRDPVISSFTASELNPHPGNDVTLTVAASDADGDTLNYAYEFTAGSGTITGSGASVTAVVDNVGLNTVRVTVTDGKGGSAVQTLNLTGTNNSPVISDFTSSEFNPHPGQSVTLTVTASDLDGDTLAYAYDFTVGSGTIIGSGPSVDATVSNTGANTIRVTVTDGHGGSATQTLDLTGTNQAPTISSFTAAAGTIFNTGADTKTVTVSATDPDSDTLTYSYSVISGLGSASGTTTTGTYTSGTASGMSAARVTVSDPYGGQATSDVQIKVCGWRQLASVSPPTAREGHSAIFDGSGHMIIFGGQDSTGVINDVWQYTIATQTWTQLNSISPPLARKWHRAIYDGGGNMIVFGGGNLSLTGYNDVWQYAIAGQTWTELASPSPPAARISHSAIYNGSGGMIIFGGIQYGCCVRYDVWRYDIVGQTWTQLTSTYDPVRTLAAHSAIFDGAGNMVVFGGAGEDLATRYNNVWQYNIAGQAWTQLASVSAPLPRDSHGAFPDGSGGMIVFGGSDGVQWFNDVWRYDIAGQTWTQYTSVNGPSARQDFGLIYDGSGNMILFGGRSSTGNRNDVWIYVLP
jgi:N-acetylneuraminic acid mutarotase